MMITKSVSLRRQQGASAFSILVGLFILSLIFTVAAKLVPIYMDNATIKSVMQSIFEDGGIRSYSDGEIMSQFEKRLVINNVRDFDTQVVKISRNKGVVSADISYEVRKNMIKNVDAVVVFSDHFEANYGN